MASNKSTRFVDNQGRIILPAYIRKALNIGKGHTVTLALDDDGTIRIKAVPERCCICGDAVDQKHYTEVETANGNKLVCFDCAQNLARAMMK